VPAGDSQKTRSHAAAGGRFSHAIVRPPGANYTEGLTASGLGPPDLKLALEQHRAYCDILRHCGLDVIELPADDSYPDSTFVEDTAVITSRGAILTRPGAAGRRGEVASIRTALIPLFPLPESIQPPGTVDGGDVCDTGEIFFIGLSSRTNEAGAGQLFTWLEDRRYEARIVDIRGESGILHLKSGTASLGEGRLAMIEALRERPEFHGFEKVTIPAGEEYAANCLRVNDTVIAPAGFPGALSALCGLGHPVVELEMSEFQKMDGGLSCLSLRF
jgi:dimethylargininase